jgi:2-desacetyl-2-hydroxyethyl bacteriochlorophyllide A dehydrogenase
MRSIYLTDDYEVEIRDLPAPEPGPGEALVRVRAGGICGTDMSTYLNTHFLRSAPQILGHEVSGELVAVGKGVEGWEPGERVFVNPLVVCGSCEACTFGRATQCRNSLLPGLELAGLFSDLIVMPAKTLHRLRPSMSWVQGALVEPTSVAHHAVGRAGLSAGDAVAVLGTGPIGSLATLICDHSFKANLLVADLKQSNLDLLERLTGCATANPRAESVTEAGEAKTGGEGFDVVLVANHSPQSLADAVDLLRPGGRIVAIAAAYEQLPPVNVPIIVWRELELRGSFGFDDDDVRAVIDLIDGGLAVEELVTHRHPPEDAPEVFAAMASGEGDRVKTIFEFA